MKGSQVSKRLRVGGSAAAAIALAAVVLAGPPATDPPIGPRSANKVTSFAYDHTEFAPLRDGRKDAGRLKFPHGKHMEQTWGPDAGEGKAGRQVSCVDCHNPDPERRLMRPISFEAHCRECHTKPLGVIDAAPGVVKAAPAPHGDPRAIAEMVDDAVLRWVAASATTPKPAATEPAPAGEAKPAEGGGRRSRGGSSESAPAEQPAGGAPGASGDSKPAEAESGGGSSRRRSGGEVAAAAPKKAAVLEFKTPEELEAFMAKQRAGVFKSFSRPSGCAYCHFVEASAQADKGEPFKVDHPNIPAQWYPRSVFHHGSHEMISCTECHAGSATSASVSDINMPGIDSCRTCHSPEGGAQNNCVLCHVYHQKSDRPMTGTLRVDQLLDSSHPRDRRKGGRPGFEPDSRVPSESKPAAAQSPPPEAKAAEPEKK